MQKRGRRNYFGYFKKGYFFTLDAFIGLTILSVGIMLLYSSTGTYSPPYSQPLSLSQDIIDSLNQLRLYEFNNAFVNQLKESGEIRDMSNTALEQIAIFYLDEKMSLATQLAQNLIGDTVPGQYDFNLKIEGDLIFGTEDISAKAKVVASSKAMVMGLMNKTDLFGPLKAEVNVWQK